MATAKAERIPVLNPFRFIKANDTLAENINTWPTDRGFFREQIRRWQYGSYCIKRNASDRFDMYIDSLAGTVELHLYDCDGNELATTYSGIGLTGVAVAGNTYNIGGVDYPFNSIYISFKFSDIYTITPARGQQKFHIALECVYDAGDRTKSTWYVSEPINVRLSNSWPKTMLIDVTNSENDYDVMFEAFPATSSFAGCRFRYRVEASISDEPAPAFTDTVFKDQDYSLQKLKSVPYRLFDLIVGGGTGVPKYKLDKINRALSCDTSLIDGVRYAKDEGANWSMVAATDCQLFSGKIRLQEYEHDGGTVYTNADDPEFLRYHDDYHDEYHD